MLEAVEVLLLIEEEAPSVLRPCLDDFDLRNIALTPLVHVFRLVIKIDS